MFHEFVGQRKLVARLCRQLEGARRHSEPFPHSLFVGPSGVGKTLLARALAKEYGTTLHAAHGNDSDAELATKLAKVELGDFLFVDEAHGLSTKAQELLMFAIDEHRLPPWIEAPVGPAAPDAQEAARVQPCTIVLATDQPGKLVNALRNRLELRERLGFYSEREMREIVDRLATDMNLWISPQARNRIAKVAGGVPRIARDHLRKLRRHCYDVGPRQLNLNDVQRFLTAHQIDQVGLDSTDRGYLRYLTRYNTASLESLALHLGHDEDYIRRNIEKQLHRLDLIVISSRGRAITDRGRQHLAALQNKTLKGTSA